MSNLDDVARTLAEGMPRRRALRVMAGAVAAAVLPGWLARPAQARRVTCTGEEFLCQCPSINGLFFNVCCPGNYKCTCKAPPDGAAICSCADDRKCGDACCKVGAVCADADLGYCCEPRELACRGGGTVSCCKPGIACCAGKCCAPGERCYKGRCRKRCPEDTRRCGHNCCDKGQACCNGKCCGKRQKCCYSNHCCAKTATCCGETCCTGTQKCCSGLCCRGTDTCCGKGCCREGTTCVTTAGVRGCCPNARVVRVGGAVVCCPAGDVAAGDRCCPAANPACNTCDPPCPAGHVCRDGFCLQV